MWSCSCRYDPCVTCRSGTSRGPSRKRASSLLPCTFGPSAMSSTRCSCPGCWLPITRWPVRSAPQATGSDSGRSWRRHFRSSIRLRSGPLLRIAHHSGQWGLRKRNRHVPSVGRAGGLGARSPDIDGSPPPPPRPQGRGTHKFSTRHLKGNEGGRERFTFLRERFTLLGGNTSPSLAGTPSRSAGNTSRSAGNTSRSAGNTSRSLGAKLRGRKEGGRTPAR